jgi:subtilisin family serine protease
MARYFIRTPRESLLNRYVAYLSESAEQHHAAVSFSDRSVLIADLSEEEAQAALEAGATLYEDIQFDAAAERNLFLDLEARVQFQDSTTPQATSGSAPVPPAKSLATVLDHIKAPAAWAQSRGAGVTIAIVDSGICPTLMEVPPARRSPISLSTAYAGAHWVNGTGHGAMCAVIAAGSADAGGRYNGVAPEATVLSARSTLLASDLYRIYDELRILKAANVITGPLVISNSTALSACSAPMRIPRDHPFLQLVELLVAEGIVVVFAAGNSHADLFCRNDPAQCGPNSIWAMNSLDVVLTVGATQSGLG